MTKEIKVCRKCHLELPIAEFVVTDKAVGRRKAVCRSCEAARVRAYYAANPEYRERAKANSKKWFEANPEKVAVHRYKSGLKYKYNLTPEQYQALLQAQGNACALCGATEHGHKHSNGKTARLPGGHSTNWPIDHCHKTGAVRGLLCHACNTRLGSYETLLDQVGEAKLLEYLTRSSPVPPPVMEPVPEAPAPRFVAELPPRYVRSNCTVDGCDGEAHGNGLCFKHYMRVRRGKEAGPAEALPHGGSKLTDDAIRFIRASDEKGGALAVRFGVSQPTISMIRNNKIWTHVT